MVSEDGKKTYPHKVSFYQDRDDTARVRGAFLATRDDEGHRSMSEFINAAVLGEVERLEVKYNNGDQFPPVEANRSHAGKPL